MLVIYFFKFLLARFQSVRLSPSSKWFSIKLNFPFGTGVMGRGEFSSGIVFITPEPKGKQTCLAIIFQPGPERFIPIGLWCIVDEEEWSVLWSPSWSNAGK